MSKNFDLIATVDIDIKNPIVDETSFDHLLLIGPAPKAGGKVPAVVLYSNIEEVQSAGYVITGTGADPVGIAARVAFAQQNKPDCIYVATQQPTAAAVAAAELIATMEAALDHHTNAYEKKGCSVYRDVENRRITVTLTVPFAEADGHGLFQALAEFVDQGYTATVDGITVEHYGQFKQTKYDALLLAMKQGDEPITFEFKMKKDGVPEVTYVITVAYPSEGADEDADEVTGPVDAPETELEAVTDTVNRALNTTGWYVMCSVGISSDNYKEIADIIEVNEKMFYYTDFDFFANGEPLVGNLYFRTAAIYGGVDREGIEYPVENEFANVAHAVAWLAHESGSETAAFKPLNLIEPADLSSADYKAMETAGMNYFITVGNRKITMNGKVVGGEWADVIRFRDWQKNDMQLSVVNLFVKNPKVPFTDGGIALVQNQMNASLKRGQNVGGIAEDEYDENGDKIPGYVTTVPRSASIPASEKQSRKLRNCKFKARLAGAIHFAELKGSLTYEL